MFRSKSCRNTNAQPVATFMIPKWVIPMAASPPEPLSKIFPKTGFAPNAALAKKTSNPWTSPQSLVLIRSLFWKFQNRDFLFNSHGLVDRSMDRFRLEISRFVKPTRMPRRSGALKHRFMRPALDRSHPEISRFDESSRFVKSTRTHPGRTRSSTVRAITPWIDFVPKSAVSTNQAAS